MVAGVGVMALQNLDAGVSFVLGLIVSVFIFASGALASFVMRSNRNQPAHEWFRIWSLAGTRNLRRTFQVCMHACTSSV
jgi:hypothetical protein